VLVPQRAALLLWTNYVVPRMRQIHGPVCTRSFLNLEKLSKARSTIEVLWGQFLCHLRCCTATLQQSTVSEPITQWKRSLSATDISSPSTASTPSGRLPVPKRCLVVCDDRLRTRRSLEFGADSSTDLAASPVVNVVSVHGIVW